MSIEGFKQKCGYEIEGMWLPRVTAITSIISQYPLFLKERGYFDDAASWGQFVHQMLGMVAKQERFAQTEQTLLLAQTFQNWIIENDVLFQNPKENVERRVFDAQGAYAGTIDLVCHVRGQKSIIDLKTSSQISPEYLLQTAGYMAAYNKQEKGECQTRWILRIDQYEECMGCLAQQRTRGKKIFLRGGNASCNHQWSSPQVVGEFIELKEYEQDVRAFVAAKELWEWHHRNLLKKISNYPKHA